MAQLPHSLDHIRQIVAADFADKPARRVELFGSYARGEAAAESDLELIIELTRPVGWEFTEYAAYAADLGEQLGIEVDAGTAVSDYVMRYIRKDLLTIYESRQKQAA